MLTREMFLDVMGESYNRYQGPEGPSMAKIMDTVCDEKFAHLENADFLALCDQIEWVYELIEEIKTFNGLRPTTINKISNDNASWINNVLGGKYV